MSTKTVVPDVRSPGPVDVFCTVCSVRLALKTVTLRWSMPSGATLGEMQLLVCGNCGPAARFSCVLLNSCVPMWSSASEDQQPKLYWIEAKLPSRSSEDGYWKCASCHHQALLPTPGLSGRYCTACQDYTSWLPNH